LRAKRSNSWTTNQEGVDCFVACAPHNDGGEFNEV
jgi:hypothetical protein